MKLTLCTPLFVKMRIHGVSPYFIPEAQAAGDKNLDAKALVALSIHGRRRMARRGR